MKKVRLVLCVAENIISSRCCTETTAYFCHNLCASWRSHPSGDAHFLLTSIVAEDASTSRSVTDSAPLDSICSGTAY